MTDLQDQRKYGALTPVWALFLLGGVFVLVVGGPGVGLALSQAPIDRAFHDTYYVVAQLHYTVSIAVWFLALAAIYFALGRWTRLPIPRWAGLVHFAMFFVGVCLMFMPQQLLGRQSMPRRYIDFGEQMAFWNFWSTLGASLAVASLVFFLSVLGLAFYRRQSARPA